VVTHDPEDPCVIAKNEHPYRTTPGREVPRGDQPVPSVIAISSHNADVGGSAAEMMPRAARDLPPGNLHQLQRGDTACDRRVVQPRDLL
jgi:hypothetical protein